jgi:hypothetical protein
LAVLAAAIGTSRTIRLLRAWQEPAVVWTAIIGESGTLKSPALDLVLRPVGRRQGQAIDRHREALAQWGESGPRPVCERYVCQDTTIEALADRLADAPRGLLLARDELAGWLKSYDQYRGGKGGDVAHWLAIHGARDLMMDRRTGERQTIYVRRAAVSITGSIQPDILRRVLSREHYESGLAARLLLAYPPRRAKCWREDDIDHTVEDVLRDTLDALYGLSLPEPDGEPKALPLSREARQLWIDWYDSHAREQAELTGDLAAAASKLEGYAARLALVLCLARWASGPTGQPEPTAIDADSMRAGIMLARWFGYEARRVYDVLAESEDAAELRQLAELIARRESKTITPRELCQSVWRYRGKTEQAEADLEQLVRAGYATWEPTGRTVRGGQPSRRLRLRG